MPRTQALDFAIRSRRAAQPLWRQRRPLIVQSERLNQVRYTHLPCSECTKNSRTNQQFFLRPSPLQFAILRRHLTSHIASARPQLPYLYNPFYRDRSFRTALIRHLTSEAKKGKWKETLKWQLRFHAYAWPMVALLFTVYIGYLQMEMEHNHPTPTEWSFWARWDARVAKVAESRNGATDWPLVGKTWSKLIKRLEDFKKDGKGLKEQEVNSAPIMVDGVGKLGLDVSAKSERWRHGYWECLMGLAQASEHLDGMCKRRGADLKDKLFKWENISGPENPRPKPVPFDKNGEHLRVPTIEEVEPAMDDPEVYYMKIMTTKGFTNRQRLDAALAYADWCEYKGLKETSSLAYKWGLDIAASGLPQVADGVLDMKTGVIKTGKEQFVTENLLKITTALGVWHARNGEVKEALPIFLSVLRARKALPPAPPHLQQAKSNAMTPEQRQAQTQGDVVVRSIRTFMDFFREIDSTQIPSTGDEQPFHSLKEACEEVGVMTYIGEILFATSEQEREKGLSWTRDSVEAAEAVLWFMDEQRTDTDQEGRQKCRDCLETGLSNWQQMTRQMARFAEKKKEEAQHSRGWLGLGFGQGSGVDKAIDEVKRWEEEEVQVELRRQKTASLVQNLKPKGNPFAMV